MTLEEIRAGIIRLLRSGTDVENITGEDVTQAKGFPLLHVQLTPLNYGAAAAGMWREKQNLVGTSSMEGRHTSNKKIYAMLERVGGGLSPVFMSGGACLLYI